MKDLDPRLTFVEYVYHPFVRGFLQWARDRAVECLEGTGREWQGLVRELELLLTGEYAGSDPVEMICPAGVDGLEEIYPSRLIDHQIFFSDLRMSMMMKHQGIEGRESRLEWSVQHLDEILQTQERILTRAAKNRLQPPIPNYEIINSYPPGSRFRALNKIRSFSYPELDYEMTEYEL